MKDDYAFPRVTQLGQMAPGMELRDWFAGMVLQGQLSDNTTFFIPDEVAKEAYEYADAMMKVRNYKPEQ
jgi:hypothetical protein